MTFVGMTPDQIDSASTQLRAQASELQSVKTRVDSLVSETSKSWNGRDAQSFFTLWYSTYQTKMIAVIDRLNTLASALAQQAADQRTTSSDTIGLAAANMPNTLTGWFQNGNGGKPKVLDEPKDIFQSVDTSDSAMNPANVDQGEAGDCWFMASLAAVASTPEGRDLLRKNMVWDPENMGYWVTLYDEVGDPHQYFVSETYKDGANHGDSWESVYESALTQQRRSINGGFGEEGMETLTGQNAARGGQDVDALREALEEGKIATVGTNIQFFFQDDRLPVQALVQDSQGNWSSEQIDIVRQHEYMVEKVDAEGNIYVRNPWGPGNTADDGKLIKLTSDQYYEYFRNQSVGSVE